MDTTALEASQEEIQAIAEHWNTNLRTSNRLRDSGTQRKPRTMFYEEPLKDERSVRDDGCTQNSTMT
jgi:hypothetical protein